MDVKGFPKRKEEDDMLEGEGIRKNKTTDSTDNADVCRNRREPRVGVMNPQVRLRSDVLEGLGMVCSARSETQPT